MLSLKCLRHAGVLLWIATLALGCASPPPAKIFRISVVDAETGRGIPAVELRSIDARSFYTDSAGTIALSEPALMRQDVFFQVLSFGYRFEQELLGWRGTTLQIVPGHSVVLRMRRENIAERLYRVTGSGIFRDSVLVGDPAPFPPRDPKPRPAGADSVLTAVYRGELFWVWGDTTLLSRPLGIFRATAATSLLPDRGGIDPEIGVDLRYFRDDTELRAMVDDPHPIIWLTALRATRDAGGEERLFATYHKIREGLQSIEEGLVEFDDAKGVFRIVWAYPDDAPIAPEGHAFRYREDGVAYLQYDMDVRSLDAAEAVRDPASYEAFTPTRPGARTERDGARALERDGSGRLVWGWKRNAPPIPHEQWEELVRTGAVAPHERPYQLIDVETGETIVPHHGSIHWNAYRRRWIMIRGQWGGSGSQVGEIYYFEGDTPLGPWAYGRKIITHSRDAIGSHGRSVRESYSFYNPMHHPEFDRAGGRAILLEGTLSTLFAEPAAPQMPGYDYNQMMYKLSLEDSRLFLPVPVYRVPGDPPTHGTRDVFCAEARLGARPPPEVAFFAPDRPRTGTVPVREVRADGRASPRLVAGEAASQDPIRFHCAPSESPPPATVPLYEQVDERGRFTYTTRDPAGTASVLCHVWPAPVAFDASLPGLDRACEISPGAAGAP